MTVFLAIRMGIKLENGDPSLFAVAGGQTKILDSRFIAAIGASIDPSAGTTFGKGVRVEWRTTRNAVSHDVLLKSALVGPVGYDPTTYRLKGESSTN